MLTYNAYLLRNDYRKIFFKDMVSLNKPLLKLNVVAKYSLRHSTNRGAGGSEVHHHLQLYSKSRSAWANSVTLCLKNNPRGTSE